MVNLKLFNVKTSKEIEGNACLVTAIKRKQTLINNLLF